MTGSRRALALASAGGLLWAVPAVADEVEAAAAARIQTNAAAVATMMDSNRDGRISKAEFFRHNAHIGRFEALDTDGDGELNAEEQAAANVGPRMLR